MNRDTVRLLAHCVQIELLAAGAVRDGERALLVMVDIPSVAAFDSPRKLRLQYLAAVNQWRLGGQAALRLHLVHL